MSDGVQRWSSILVGAVVVVLVSYLTLLETKHPKARAESVAPSASSAEAAKPVASASAATPSAEPEPDAGLALGFPSFFGDGGALPHGAPRTVHLGVVLVQYVGAEGASSTARNKREALEHAQKLLDGAKSDFKKAVKEGDSGSSEDIGRIPRGVLDPRTEMAVFSLGAGDVSDVLETPKGYWIVKRIE
jgi:hypothetical protein